MQKVNKTSLNVSITLALLVAISIISGKFLAFRVGDILRFSFENLPILFAGVAFGPVAGALVGVVADLLGCIMVGYTINPIVTLGAAALGAVAGGSALLLKKNKLSNRLTLAISVICAHFIGSVVIKTAGLAAFYAMPYFVLTLWRGLNYVIVGAVEYFILVALFSSKGVTMQLGKLKGEKK